MVFINRLKNFLSWDFLNLSLLSILSYLRFHARFFRKFQSIFRFDRRLERKKKQNMEAKAKRQANWTTDECLFLASEVRDNFQILKGKFGPSLTSKMKKDKWERIAKSLSAQYGSNRSGEQTEKKWSNLLAKAKPIISDHKREIQRTGIIIVLTVLLQFFFFFFNYILIRSVLLLIFPHLTIPGFIPTIHKRGQYLLHSECSRNILYFLVSFIIIYFYYHHILWNFFLIFLSSAFRVQQWSLFRSRRS